MNDHKDIEKLTHRILSGKQIFYHNNIGYEYRKPSLSLRMRADVLYDQTYQENLYENFWLAEDIENLAIEIGLISWDHKKYQTKLNKTLDSYKINLYKSFFDSQKRNRLKTNINNLRKDINKQHQLEHSLDYLSLEYFCENLKNEFIITNSLYFIDTNELVFKEDKQYSEFNTLMSYISSNVIDITIYKKIARNDYWRNYWSNNKYNIFDEPVKEWSEEQKTLVNLSAMYDRIYEHPESPNEDIINDDDALDGWMLVQKEENAKQKKEKGVDNMLSGKIKNSSEVFLMAKDKTQAEDILALNTNESMSIIKQKIETVVSSSSPLRDAELPDVKQKIMEQMHNQIKG